jgi:16S rRNA processing protein RimM
LIAFKEPEITIGTVVSPFGTRGEVKVRIETDFPDRFESLAEIWLKPKIGQGRKVRVEAVRFHGGGALVKLETCDDRTSAAELRGAELRIARTELKELEADRFYEHDILGLDVYTTDGDHLGPVTEVLQGPANDVYVTPRALLPALKQVVRKIDLSERTMVVEPIEGLVGNGK